MKLQLKELKQKKFDFDGVNAQIKSEKDKVKNLKLSIGSEKEIGKEKIDKDKYDIKSLQKEQAYLKGVKTEIEQGIQLTRDQKTSLSKYQEDEQAHIEQLQEQIKQRD